MKSKWILDLRLVALCTAYLLLPTMACPAQCVCKWKNGKRYVECVDKDLKQIPRPLDPETQVLDFAGNDIQVLPKEVFQKLGLFDLQKIYLSRCRIHKVDNYAFKALANLVELDLSNNYLTIVPSANFIYFPSLMRLSLNNNPISVIKTHSFQNLMFLNTLELNECKIETIERDAFAGLHHLEWLRLKGNRLSTIEGDNIFPDTLRGIDLLNNNWNCDCLLKSLYEWLQKFNLPQAVEPVCLKPERLKNKIISSLAVEDLACAPTIEVALTNLETNEGNNVTFDCIVNAIPEAQLTWRFKNQMIQNQSKGELDFKYAVSTTGTNQKRSELIIYNADGDDNGTFFCVAANVAGRVQTNFSLKVIKKEEPEVVVVTFPRRHLVIIVTGVFLVIVLAIAIVAVVLLKFKTNTKSQKKKESRKDMVLKSQNNSPRNINNGITVGTLQRKMNGSLIANAQTNHIVHYTLQESAEENFNADNMKSFSERNPDIINDAETVANNTHYDDFLLHNNQRVPIESTETDSNYSLQTVPRQVTWQDQQGVIIPPPMPYSMYQYSADIHLNPGCFLDTEGYPYDYGLPRMQFRAIHPSHAFNTGYQTLPHNRTKSQKLSCKFAKDNEFNALPQPCMNFDSTDFRHTVEGYPTVSNRPAPFNSSSVVFIGQPGGMANPSEVYNPESRAVCCALPKAEPCSSCNNPKGTCAVMVPIDIPETGPGKSYHIETRCVDTQTPELRQHPDSGDQKHTNSKGNPTYELEVCTESPDEGYVGDAVDT